MKLWQPRQRTEWTWRLIVLPLVAGGLALLLWTRSTELSFNVAAQDGTFYSGLDAGSLTHVEAVQTRSISENPASAAPEQQNTPSDEAAVGAWASPQDARRHGAKRSAPKSVEVPASAERRALQTSGSPGVTGRRDVHLSSTLPSMIAFPHKTCWMGLDGMEEFCFELMEERR